MDRSDPETSHAAWTRKAWGHNQHYPSIAYEWSDWKGKATQQHEEFLAFWTGAASGIEAVDNANAPLAYQKNKS